ncbi:hypothetical protein DVK02_06680 [Halobellus sp. Atlit-31R]|nr:hypothetical protein DVK02_06680 [Halobellus sp. Atlit-31R]
MFSESNVLGSDVGHVIASALQSTSSVVYVLDPTPDVVEALVDVAAESETVPTIRVLADEQLLKDVMEDFLVASSAADLVADGVLELRVVEEPIESTLLVTDAAVVAVVSAGDHVAGLSTDDEEFVQSAHDTYRDRFRAAETFRLRAPAISAVFTSLEADLGSEVRSDFDAVLDSLETVRGDGTSLDEVTISLLVAAKNDVLLYDVSKWGEDVGIASKATFSRTKTELEDLGLIETEKVPIDVGRPRLRLRLGDDRLHDVPATELAAVARDILG